MKSQNVPISICFLASIISFHGYSTLAAEHVSRKFSIKINPECETILGSDCSTNSTLNLVHIRSDGPHDTLHFLWSFLGSPSLLLARTPLQSNLSVDWISIFEDAGGAISFEPAPYYVFGWSLVKVWVYNDQNDTARLDKADQSEVEDYDAKNFLWSRVDNSSILNSTMVRMSFEARAYDHKEGEAFGAQQMGPHGFFKITIRMKSTEDYSTVLPYMMYNENSTQVDIAFNDVQLNTTAEEYPNHPRIAFKYIMVQDNGNRNAEAGKMHLDVTKTLDDEHSPGVFEVYSVNTPAKGSDQSYMQWKPICYTAEVRDVIDSVDVVAYSLQNASSVLHEDNVQDSILWSYFGAEIDNVTLQAMNISFGTVGDGFYNKTKHISWTYSTGFGVPPPDRVSLLVMLVVSIGLGIPVLIIVLSVIYMLMCRVRRPRDDLLLGQ
ncbi:unnamed protein product [Orchesella dallaii]|uniref:Glycosylated lysosomal membrane protein B n=1 Tax=Orchesella dallaii TaxID=48710 RepID=A0ABP1PQ14_9HEXA